MAIERRAVPQSRTLTRAARIGPRIAFTYPLDKPVRKRSSYAIRVIAHRVV